MNLKLFTLTVLLINFCLQLNGQGTWIQKAQFPGSSRVSCISFSIGNKGYVGIGFSCEGIGTTTNGFDYYLNDFWEYDPTSNIWTKKANFPGIGRGSAIGFAIGDKGYIGGGYDPNSTWHDDFWEYNPASDTWTQKANIQGGRVMAVGFSIANKGYICMGDITCCSVVPDLWEYNPTNDSWTKKADFAGVLTYDEVAFSINGKAYIATGEQFPIAFWEYDPINDSWNQKANFAGTPRDEGTAFANNCMGYVLLGGHNGLPTFDDMWQYNPSTNSWAQKQSYPGLGRNSPIGFSIGSFGYAGLGIADRQSDSCNHDFWQYTPDTLCVTGTNEIPVESAIFVGSNPFHDKVSFTVLDNEQTTISLYDFLGQQVLRQSFTNSTTINTAQLADGIYFYELRSNKGTLKTGKLVKQ